MKSQRFRAAVEKAREDLKRIQKNLGDEGSFEAAEIIETHIQMLSDPIVTESVEKGIEERRENAEAVFQQVMGTYEKEFAREVGDNFFRQRLLDVRDLYRRILSHLLPSSRTALSQIPPNFIVFAKELIPSETAEASHLQIIAFVTERGGETSHAALIARAKGIPFVTGFSIDTFAHLHGSDVIVDGKKGRIILHPSVESRAQYAKAYEESHTPLDFSREISYNKEPISLLANVESLADLKRVKEAQAAGIGLFRTEFLFPPEKLLTLSVEEQTQIYAQILEEMDGDPVVFRLFDIGGDKLLSIAVDEPNPALGCRGIRFLLRHRDILRRQIKALLKAHGQQKLKLLLPMISDISEVREVKREIAVLNTEACPLELGIMIEVPAAALTIGSFVSECDFFSIGTNDLIQYTMASDRRNPQGHRLHPSLVRLIEMIVDESEGKPVSLCGELASDTEFTEKLLEIGVRTFSCAPRYISQLRDLF